ncbi:MAG: PDZ domain-containing protein [Lewinellaceae bacterium]|nr:PDZ domain-containing protein [Saprospiraceae bacterium]MCB9340522.1 PDZ domain-containing protein [Lewinellaceae bacterium]
MKKIFLSAICTLTLLILAGNTLLVAQEESHSSDKVIVIQKQKGDDGTVIIKKKRFEKGEALDVYVKELELDQDNDKDIEVIIVGEGENAEKSDAGETLMYIRGAGERKIKISGTGDFEKEFEKIKLDLKNAHEFKHDNEHFRYNYDYEFNFDNDHDGSTVKMVETRKTFLGVYPENDEQGVLLTGVVEGSGAKAAGLQAGDVMTSINGKTIRTTDDLGVELAKYKGGDLVSISYLRKGQEAQANVTLSEKTRKSYVTERDPCRVFIGVYVGSYGHGEEGVGVNGIVAGSDWPAEKAGLRKGDRIVAIDGMPVYDQASLVQERDKHEPGQYFTLTILRDGEYKDVEAQFKACPKNEAQEETPVAEKITEAAPNVPQNLELIDNSLELEELAAYPNPTFGNLNVRFRGEAVPTTVTVTDITGKVVHQETIQNFDGMYNKLLDVSAGSPGNLVLSIRQDGKIISTPVVLLNRA